MIIKVGVTFSIMKGEIVMKLRSVTVKNRLVQECQISKFHMELENFDANNILLAQKTFLKRHCVVSYIPHFIRRRYEKCIPEADIKDILKYGCCFEYKLVNGALYRMAFRVSGEKINGNKILDYIFIIEPYGNPKNGEVEIRFITCYANRKSDTHRTLRIAQYQH